MKTKTTHMTMTALFAALIFITIAFFLHIPFGGNGGYIHIGDALIYLAASILPRPYAICAAVIGGTLADLTTAPIWAPATFLIKMLIALCFTSSSAKIVSKRNIVGSFLAFPITIIGYYLAEVLIFGNVAAAIPSMVGNFIQCTGSSIVYIFLGLTFDRMNLKTRHIN